MARTLTLSFSCPDTSGIVAGVSAFVAGHKGWITEASQHTETELGRFFMRVEIRAESLDFPAEEFAARFAPVAARFGMDWKVSDSAQPRRVVLLCSKQEHCLYDLLARHVAQDFPFVVPCVISNHENHRKVVEAHGIPFHYVPVTPENKHAAYRQMEQLFREAQADLIVLARYMQVLDEAMCRDFAGKIINICSVMSELGRPGTAPYTASKGALKMLTKGMAVDWGPHGIQVNGIGPGYFKTELTEALVNDATFSGWLIGRTPAKRWGQVQDLVGAAVFLSSDASAFVNGHVLYVDGGVTASL